MNIKKIVLLITILNAMTFAAMAEDRGIPMVGAKEDGSPIEIVVPTKIYSERVQTALTEVETSTLTALSKTTQSSQSWRLRSVVVGLGLNMEIKLGPIIKFGALPRFRVGFSNAKDPSFP